ncbi:PadR family transcriptional regulator [Lacisediminihabitans changchengi]|uniref:PadR family transcriptional regulator n=1 Tax=Lacisediminihabitans changchengi TaxID=2787634 RepID=A0A934SLR9_9MICO|nr:PadR family transcriptional regulator [Lacisediminihabitans changchengi]MBK4349057.1 PadR family transcriptional regulator [Lacisediminihabitans changchengi]
MSGAFTGDGFTGFRGGSGDGWPGGAIWAQLEQLRGQFFDRMPGATGARRDVRAALLALLSEQPMTGSQLISAIQERSGGAWTPTPGAVYPELQLLVDEGLGQADQVEGRKTYSLTDEGRRVAGMTADGPSPWEAQPTQHRAGALPRAGIDLAQATATVARTGSPEQVEQAVAVLAEARRKLFAILAQD